MKAAVGFVLILLGSLTLSLHAAAQGPSADVLRRQAEMKAEYERRAAEIKRKFDERSRQTTGQRQPTTRQAVPFNAAAAPKPEACLRAYVAAARQATSKEQVLPYLPQAKQRALREYQATYDPGEAARGRAWHRQQNPSISEKTLTYITNPPFVNELARHKGIAGKFLDVLSVKIDGYKAVIEVSTKGGGRVNGVKYPYGTAKVEMVGEGQYWMVDGYNDDNVVYLHTLKRNR